MGISETPLWGRAWNLTVTLASGKRVSLSQSGWDPEALRVKFDVLQAAISSPYWFADIAVYNANGPTMQSILGPKIPKRLTLEAGYQTGVCKSSVIWDGPVLQVIFEAENVVDQIIRFNCIATDALLENNFINTAVGPMSQYQVVSKMISQMNGTPSEQISQVARGRLSAEEYPRGKTLFGKVAQYIPQMAGDNGLGSWIGPNGQHFISELDDPDLNRKPDIVYGPPFPPGHVGQEPRASNANITRSILHTPAQSPDGCNFTVLLDPRLTVKAPPMLVELDQAIISQMKRKIPEALLPLDIGGQYVAAQIRHYGDTRGNDWCTDVTGYRRGYAQLFSALGG